METRETPGVKMAAIGNLSMDAVVVLASSKLSAENVEQARRSGNLSMKTPDGQMARLEVGGVVVAEGVLQKKHGNSAFIVTRTYQESSGRQS